MDSEKRKNETIIKVTSWLRGIWDMRKRPNSVQQWVDSLPSPAKSLPQENFMVDFKQKLIKADIVDEEIDCEDLNKENNVSTNMTVSTPIDVPPSPAMAYPGVSKLVRDSSFQSDSSHCSSIESLLELRKADPEAILISLGFGGCPKTSQESTGPLSRIPKRFMQPSKLKGITLTDFVKHQQETTESLDSTSLGYRGLTGSPYVVPSEIVQKIMQRLREHESQDSDTHSCLNNTNNNNSDQLPTPIQEGRLSVLSPDNRNFLDRPRAKSPDMRTKRMIIGQRSFAFGTNGDLIEISSDNDFSTDLNDSAEVVDQQVKIDKMSLESCDVSNDDISNTRRSSEGFGGNNNNEQDESGRRFSDGAVDKKREALISKRKSFKRQARIGDYGSTVDGDGNQGVFFNFRVNDDLVDSISCDKLEDSNNKTKDFNNSCQCGESDEGCDKSDVHTLCCFKKSGQQCRPKVKNKKKSETETFEQSRQSSSAEVRDMLSSVLSIRLEPGF